MTSPDPARTAPPDAPPGWLRTTRGVCRECRRVVDAHVLVEDGRVWQERRCPEHGASRALIADDVAWYRSVIDTPIQGRPPGPPRTETRLGCPLDCGTCPSHRTAPNLPVFSVTNACNLDCPICFTYNRPDRVWNMPPDELDALLDSVLRAAPDLDLVNVTGGEPTLHPQILELLRRATGRAAIGRVTMNSNGVRIARDEAFCAALARLGVYVILSFDTLKRDRSLAIHGTDMVDLKLRALANLEAHGIGTTLLNVMIRGTNEDEIGEVLRLAATRPTVRSVTIQTMTYTGQGGKSFPRGLHMTLDGALAAMERSSNGLVRATDFHPMPAAHPLCYCIGYFFKVDGRLIPFRTLFEEAELRELIGPHYLIRPGADFDARLNDAIARHWAAGGDPAVLRALRDIVKRLFPSGRPLTPFERQRRAEQHVLTVYVHAHMDEDNFDLERICTCPDLVPDASGRMVPACSYNVFYRHNDPRFWVAEKPGRTP